MKLLIISGISGSGKSVACNTLEDLGYFCIDNLPVELLKPIVQLHKKQIDQNMAVVIDSRSEKIGTLIDELKDINHDDYQLVFIDCEADLILNRYKQTRRKHPMLSDKVTSLEKAIELEYEITKQIKHSADIIIDTTDKNVNLFKKEIIDLFKPSDYQGMSIKIISFGYRNGIPNEADLVVDVRCLLNPYYVNELKDHTGLEKDVVDYIFSSDNSHKFCQKLMDFIEFSIPLYQQEGKSELVIGIGCTGGHHRSVTISEYIKKKLENKYHIIVVHRDIEKEY